MATKKIKNLMRQPRVFNLERPYFVNNEGDHPVGKPEVLTMRPLEICTVHEEVLLCAAVKNALNPRKGRATLRIIG